MFKKTFRELLSLKYGAVTLLLVALGAVFFLGAWWGQKTKTPLFDRQPELSEEEKRWREQGLSFGDGIYFVGSEIAPGIYRTKGIDTSIYGCSWQRLSGFKAENNNVITNYREDKGMPTIVMIDPRDRGFKTQGCGFWYAESIPVTENANSFNDGAFIVGVDIQPGTYKSIAQTGCYWERLSGLSRDYYAGRLFGQDTELITYSNATIAEIAPSDKGFISYNCKQWVLQSS